MAILKIISHNKTKAGMKKLLAYVLDPKKTRPYLCSVSGDFAKSEVTPQAVYREFVRIRELFTKTGGRICTHGVISFAPGEVQPEEAAAFAEDFVQRIYPEQQVLTATHIDTGHIHFHFVVNCVRFTDGKMLHTSKKDLEHAKEVCNAMCRERNWSIPQKGHDAEGNAFEEGTITSWSKNKWHQMEASPQKSYLVE